MHVTRLIGPTVCAVTIYSKVHDATPRTSLGEITALPQTSWWLDFVRGMEGEREVKRKEKAKGKGKANEREVYEKKGGKEKGKK